MLASRKGLNNEQSSRSNPVIDDVSGKNGLSTAVELNELHPSTSSLEEENGHEDFHRIEAMERAVLNKIDRFLSNFDSKLSDLEKYLSQTVSLTDNDEDISSNHSESSDEADETVGSVYHAYSKLSETFSSVKNYLHKNQQHNLHPLTAIIDNYYEQQEENEQEKQREAKNEKGKEMNGGGSKLTRQNLIHTIQILNGRLTDFEHHHNLPSFATHPSERLIALKETLYNYDTAMTVSNTRNLTFYELPFQWRENRYIIYGYRFAKSHFSAITSLFGWHNESINIWSHLLGAFYLMYMGIYSFPASETYQIYGPSSNDHAIVYLFIASAIVCLIFSAVWHSYTNIAYLTIRSKFACFDYSGITVLITSSIITTEHISLKDYPTLRFAFVFFSVMAGIVGIGMAWHPYFDKPESRIIRIIFFVSLSGLGFASFFCSCVVHSVSFAWNLFSPLYISFVWYLLGIVFYGTFFPECCRSDVEVDDFEISDETIFDLDRKGKLLEYLRKQPVHTCHHSKIYSLWWVDWIGNSHNFWHLFVLGGILGHYSALMEMFKRAYESM